MDGGGGTRGAGSTGGDAQKKSLYQRLQDKKRGPGISDEDLQKYTGKTREQLSAWSETQPGVGKNQLAGSIAVGPTSGLGGTAAGAGLGGWGPSAVPNDGKRGMKFPPPQPAHHHQKKLDDDDDDDDEEEEDTYIKDKGKEAK